MTGPPITVLTATWNRASTLPRLKASLEAQTYSNFEWLVVDDGSTDETIGLIEQWQLDSTLAIILLRRQNGGKHRSVNDGMRAANGRWIFIVDSDDRLPNRAIENITIHLPSIEAIPNVAGLSGLKADFSGHIIGESFPAEIKFCDAISLTYRYGIRADKADVYKKEVLASFPFPEFEGERFLTEAVIWYRIANAGYALLLTNEVLYECEYRGDGLSAHSLELRIANPIGTLLFYKEIVGYDLPYRAKLREASNYMRFCRHYRRSSCFDPRDLEQVSHAYLPPKLRIPASIIGNAAYLYDQLTLARSRNTRNRCNVSASMPFDTK
ncbi:MAG TPA: glycosyltransferase family A protein, partial [Rectinema sp.]|nr:glycosyltransferase family A protein [Rectinema sp.]